MIQAWRIKHKMFSLAWKIVDTKKDCPEIADKLRNRLELYRALLIKKIKENVAKYGILCAACSPWGMTFINSEKHVCPKCGKVAARYIINMQDDMTRKK